jgi:cell division protein FtsI/penicillin-binding protein 2
MSRNDRKADVHTRRRILFAAVVFCVVLSLAVMIRLSFLQIINQEFYEQKALSSQTRDVTIYPTRGTIYDTNGKPLAISASTEMLILNPRQIAPKMRWRRPLCCLSNVSKNFLTSSRSVCPSAGQGECSTGKAAWFAK